MKRLPIILAALALLAMSCAQADKHKPRIGLAMSSFDEQVSIAIRGAVETAALDKAELAIIDGKNQQSTQDKQAEALLDRGIGAIAINPVDASALGPVIEKAKAEKVPIVFFGPEPSGENMLSWDKLFFVGTRIEDVRVAQGEMLAAYWKTNASADHDNDGLLRYVVFAEAAPAQDAAPQTETAAKALGAAGIRNEMLASIVVGEGAEGARRATTVLLAKFGEKIEAFACDNDDEALGAIDALKAAGFIKGKKHIAVVGAHAGELDAPVAAALQAGSLFGTVGTDRAAQGKAVFDLAYSLARGYAPWRSGWKITDAKYIWVPCKKTTKADLAAKK